LRFRARAPIVLAMGDKSPKAKQRDQKQKNVAKAADAARARGKQDSFSQPVPPRGKK